MKVNKLQINMSKKYIDITFNLKEEKEIYILKKVNTKERNRYDE